MADLNSKLESEWTTAEREQYRDGYIKSWMFETDCDRFYAEEQWEQFVGAAGLEARDEKIRFERQEAKEVQS